MVFLIFGIYAADFIWECAFEGDFMDYWNLCSWFSNVHELFNEFAWREPTVSLLDVSDVINSSA